MNWVDYLLLALVVGVGNPAGLRLGAGCRRCCRFGGSASACSSAPWWRRRWWVGQRERARPARHGRGLRRRSRLRWGGRILGARFSGRSGVSTSGPSIRSPGWRVAVGSPRWVGRSGWSGASWPTARFMSLDRPPWTGRTSCTPWTGSSPRLPSVFSRVESFLDSEGFSRRLRRPPAGGGAPRFAGPTNGAVRAAVVRAERSTVQIVGAGCGVIQEGSGFVVAPGLVVHERPCRRRRRPARGPRRDGPSCRHRRVSSIPGSTSPSCGSRD